VVTALSLIVFPLGCSDSPGPASTSPSATPSSAAPSPKSTAVKTPAAAPSPRPTMDARAALRDIDHLASEIGPREATSGNFAEAAEFVERRFERLGYDVRRTTVKVPPGNSWGTPARRGSSVNVIAEPKDFDPSEAHVVIAAHLDTVPVAPGAEDNASGIAVLLQLAAMVSQQPAGLPVQFIAFGAEEPRGSGDALHHFGSRQHVATLSRSQRRAVQAMVALDRVGVRASYVPVCTANSEGNRVRDALRAAARRADIPTRTCTNYSSDHWSYAKAGVPAIRLGSIPYAGYHSRGDVPSVVDRRQLDRVGRSVWAWLQTLN
jgi:Peptidase family M28